MERGKGITGGPRQPRKSLEKSKGVNVHERDRFRELRRARKVMTRGEAFKMTGSAAGTRGRKRKKKTI